MTKFSSLLHDCKNKRHDLGWKYLVLIYFFKIEMKVKPNFLFSKYNITLYLLNKKCIYFVTRLSINFILVPLLFQTPDIAVFDVITKALY